MANSNKFCTECGAPNTNGGKFCSQCGFKFPEQGHVCSGCGAELMAGAMFCSACGTRVESAGPVPASSAVIHSEPIPREEHYAAGPVTGGYVPGQKVIKDGREYTVVEEKGCLTFQDEAGRKFVEAGSFFAAQLAERARADAPQATYGANPAETTVPTVEQQPLWDPRAETPAQPAAEQTTSDDLDDPRMPPLEYLQKMKASAKGAAEVEPEEEPDPEPQKRSWFGRKKATAPTEPASEQTAFESSANADGYYNDLKPYDYDFVDDNRKNIPWLTLTLGIVGIGLFAFVLIQLSNYL